MRNYALSCVAVYLAVLSSACLLLLYEFPIPADAIALDEARFVSHEGVLAPDAGDVRVTLPDDWRHRQVDGRNGWYRAELHLEQPVNSLWSVVIPTVRMNAEVYVNGQLVGNGGRFDDPVARNIRNPLIFNLPNGLLRVGVNEFAIRIKAGADKNGFLSPLYVGPEPSLRAAYRTHYWLRVTVMQLITFMLTLIGIAIGVLAFLRHSDEEYRYFSVGVLMWSLHSLSFFVVRIPFSDRLWDWIGFATLGYFSVIGGVIYVHRYIGIKHRRWEIASVTFIVAASIVLALLPDRLFYSAAYFVWHPVCQAFGFYGMVRMSLVAWKRRDLELHIIGASGMVLIVYSVHDLSLSLAVGDWQDGYLIHYSMPLILGLFCAVLLKRFVGSLNEAEVLNRDLEMRVQASHESLERQYTRLQSLEKERVLAEERDRLMRDMHDGIGGQLISTLAVIDQGHASLPQIEASLRDALQDLRLMIDSLDMGGEDIAAMLGMFRSRVQPSLEARGIQLTWDIGEVSTAPDFGADNALHLLRILQEAVTNVLRHSEATQLTISAHDRNGSEGKCLRIEVRDNGSGIDATATPGRGLANMRQRAARIGGELSIESSQTGTCIVLCWWERRGGSGVSPR